MLAAVCDDNAKTLNAQASMIRKVFEEKDILCIVHQYSSPQKLLDAKRYYNFIFVDVEMPEMSGMEFAKRIHKKHPNCFVFFVTNHNVYMDNALDSYAFRFWTKPIDKHRLSDGIDSALARMEEKKSCINITDDKGNKYTFLIKNIIFIYTKDRKTYVITTSGKIRTNERFKHFYEKLKNKNFVKTHASYMVNLAYVAGLDKFGVKCFGVKDESIILSRRCTAEFDKRFVAWAGGMV